MTTGTGGPTSHLGGHSSAAMVCRCSSGVNVVQARCARVLHVDTSPGTGKGIAWIEERGPAARPALRRGPSVITS
jgi:hypothetical protein